MVHTFPTVQRNHAGMCQEFTQIPVDDNIIGVLMHIDNIPYFLCSNLFSHKEHLKPAAMLW